MKLNSLFIPALAAAGLAAANAQETTIPVGYTSQSLSQGFNLVGLTLHSAPAAQGDFETVSGTALTDDELSFVPTAGRQYILEIVTAADNSLVGTVQVIADTAISGTGITTPDDLDALGLAAGDEYKLRAVPTLEEIFTTDSLGSGGVLQAGLAATVSDLVWIPDGSGAYNRYYLNFAAGEFRNADTNLASPDIPIPYADGFFIQKRGATPATLTISGEVKTVGTISVLGQGFNVISRVAPTGLNLWNAGLEDDIQAGLASTVADLVWVQQANLTYKKYFRHPAGNWRDADNPLVPLTQVDAEAIALTSAILIQKRAAGDTELDLDVPDNFSNL